MAKHRRTPPPPPRASASSSAEGGVRTQGPKSAASAAAPARRASYVEAVTLYERGLEALQRHDYAGATSQFEAVLRQYPDEKELHERVRLYLNICQRHASRQEPSPQTVAERLFASTIALNGGRYDEAIS